MAYYGYSQPGYGVPAPSYLRQQQVDWMRQRFGTFIKDIRNGELFELPVKTPALSCKCIITLPDGFPEQSAPYVVVEPKSSHPWINEHGYVLHPAFLNWNANTNLALVLDEIIKDLDRYAQVNGPRVVTPPPRPVSMPSAAVPPSVYPPMYGSHSSGNIAAAPMPNTTALHAGPSAAIPPSLDRPIGFLGPTPSSGLSPQPQKSQHESYPEVERLSTSELEELLKDESKLDAFCRKLPAIANITSVLDDTRKENLSLASMAYGMGKKWKNISKEEELKQAKEVLASKYEELSRLQSESDRLTRELEEASKKYAPRAILQQLEESAKKIDEQTEEIANEFMDGVKDVKEFIQEFKHQRAIYHCRAAKAERLHERLDATGQ